MARLEFEELNYNCFPGCSLLEKSVWAIVSDQDSSNDWHLESLFSHFHIPYMRIRPGHERRGQTEAAIKKSRPDSGKRKDTERPSFIDGYSLNLHPSYSLINKGLRELMEQNGHWKGMTLIYETHDGKSSLLASFDAKQTASMIASHFN